MSTMIDDRDGYNPPRGKRANFGTIGRRHIKCAGLGGPCGEPAVMKSGRLWFCRWHAPRGSEG